jgi:hypothetical protein
MDLPCPSLYNGEDYQSILKSQMEIYHCDDITDRIVFYELNGQTYTSGFTLMKYGDAWKITSLNSVIAGQSSYGTADKMSEADYLQLLD